MSTDLWRICRSPIPPQHLQHGSMQPSRWKKERIIVLSYCTTTCDTHISVQHAPALAAAAPERDGPRPITLTAPPAQPASRPPVSQRFRLRVTPARLMPDPDEETAPPSPDRHAGSDASTSWVRVG